MRREATTHSMKSHWRLPLQRQVLAEGARSDLFITLAFVFKFNACKNCKGIYCPQSFSGGGLYSSGNGLLLLLLFISYIQVPNLGANW